MLGLLREKQSLREDLCINSSMATMVVSTGVVIVWARASIEIQLRARIHCMFLYANAVELSFKTDHTYH